jgi:hypothetical protein
MIDYMGPSLDTTIFGISSGVWLFAKHPEEWDKVRESPSLVANAVNEVVRLESPAVLIMFDQDLLCLSKFRGSRGAHYFPQCLYNGLGSHGRRSLTATLAG